MKPTIYDVADKAGVSISTVSRVINNTGRISEKTKNKVRAVIETLKYQPSVMASALTGKRTRTIGLIIPDVAKPFFAELCRRIEDYGREMGFSLLICNTDNNVETEEMSLVLLRQKSVDGILFGTTTNHFEILNNLLKEQFPVVLIANDIPELSIDSVCVDDFLGGYIATSHLVSLGHSSIAAIFGTMSRTSEKSRFQAYRQVLEENGIPYDKKLVLYKGYTVEDGKQAALEILTSPNRPTAIFAYNDFHAVGVYQAAKKLGLKIPDDLSVIGFDNTSWAEIVDPQLTTVAFSMREMGRLAINLLVQQINNQKSVKQRLLLQPELVLRDSTKRLM